MATGSEFAAAVGISPYKSRAQLWREKRDRVKRSDEDEDNPAMAWGREWEPHARDVLSEHLLELPVRTCGIFELRDARFASSPDGICADGCPVEIKCPYTGDSAARPRPDQVVQCMAHMAATGQSTCHFFNFAPDGLCRYTPVRWNDPDWATIYEGLCIFADFVQHSTEPPPRISRRPVLQQTF